MGYYDEDFYDVPGEFDAQVEEFKQSLAASVQSEILADMEGLKKENAELQEVKKNWESLQGEYASKVRQLDLDRQNLERSVRREWLSTLMQDFQVTLYCASSRTEKLPKCNKCDVQRRIKYTTPLGREAYEDCTCKGGKKFWEPEEQTATEFKLNREGTQIVAWYKPYKDDSDTYVSANFAETIYKPGTDYAELRHWGTYFRTKEECQAYCNYLNSKGR